MYFRNSILRMLFLIVPVVQIGQSNVKHDKYQLKTKKFIVALPCTLPDFDPLRF